MKKNILTVYLSIFLLICIVLDGILLCWLSPKEHLWNNWMAMVPIIYMVLGAFYANFMKKNVDSGKQSMAWLFIYKGIKLIISILIVVLYLVFIKENAKAFILITAASYLIALIAETGIFTDYLKKQKHE